MATPETHSGFRFYQSNAETETMTGGYAIAQMLALYKAGPMFGMGGFQLLPFYDAVAKVGLTHNLINDERTAIFSACAYAQVSGKPGICDATLGPGATNLVTGLSEAQNTAIPLVCLVGDANREHSRKNMTQEGNQVEILRPTSKEVICVESVQRIPEAVRRAFAVATSGRPGPVVINLPEDVCHAEYDFPVSDLYADLVNVQAPAHRAQPPASDLAIAAEKIAKAERPILLIGGGIHISRAYEALDRIASAENIPVAHTITGKGSMPCAHPLNAGLFGRYTRCGNDLIEKSDLLIVVGCKLGEIATKRYQLIPPNVEIIHIDSNADEFSRTTPTSQCLWGDAQASLDALADVLADGAETRKAARAPYAAELADLMEKWREETVERRTSEESPVHIARMVQDISDAMDDDGIIVADGGFAAHWTSLVFNTKIAGRTYVADRGFASIGFGIPGALGVHMAKPDAQVVAVTGDGGFNMSMGDLETMLRMNIPATIIIVNNAASGYIKALQNAMYGGHYQSCDLHELDFAKVADAMGCQGLSVKEPDDLKGALEKAFAEKGRPTVIDVAVTRDPVRMLPAVDSRTVKIKKGDRPI